MFFMHPAKPETKLENSTLCVCTFTRIVVAPLLLNGFPSNKQSLPCVDEQGLAWELIRVYLVSPYVLFGTLRRCWCISLSLFAKCRTQRNVKYLPKTHN